MDQLRQFSIKKLKNRRGKNIQPSEKNTDFSIFELVSGHNLFQGKKNTVPLPHGIKYGFIKVLGITVVCVHSVFFLGYDVTNLMIYTGKFVNLV